MKEGVSLQPFRARSGCWCSSLFSGLRPKLIGTSDAAPRRPRGRRGAPGCRPTGRPRRAAAAAGRGPGRRPRGPRRLEAAGLAVPEPGCHGGRRGHACGVSSGKAGSQKLPGPGRRGPRIHHIDLAGQTPIHFKRDLLQMFDPPAFIVVRDCVWVKVDRPLLVLRNIIIMIVIIMILVVLIMMFIIIVIIIVLILLILLVFLTILSVWSPPCLSLLLL